MYGQAPFVISTLLKTRSTNVYTRTEIKAKGTVSQPLRKGIKKEQADLLGQKRRNRTGNSIVFRMWSPQSFSNFGHPD